MEVILNVFGFWLAILTVAVFCLILAVKALLKANIQIVKALDRHGIDIEDE